MAGMFCARLDLWNGFCVLVPLALPLFPSTRGILKLTNFVTGSWMQSNSRAWAGISVIGFLRRPTHQATRSAECLTFAFSNVEMFNEWCLLRRRLSPDISRPGPGSVLAHLREAPLESLTGVLPCAPAPA